MLIVLSCGIIVIGLKAIKAVFGNRNTTQQRNERHVKPLTTAKVSTNPDGNENESKSIHQLLAISPLDGRYAKSIEDLCQNFSEFGLIRARVVVELRWLSFISTKLPDVHLDRESLKFLETLADTFTVTDALAIKTIEKTTRHDVKAVEYWIKQQLQESSLEIGSAAEFVHFACTSEDINNLAWSLCLKDGIKTISGTMKELMNEIKTLAIDNAGVSMLSRTHGQSASPTTLGKELAVFAHRLNTHFRKTENFEIKGKINGAVGNYNAHMSAYPEINWPELACEFVKSLGLAWNPYTTQIEPHDYIAELFQIVNRFNVTLIDLDRDMWSYISLAYFKQKRLEGEVGSSTMPHKINPIDFENSEGNLGFANAILEHFARKLPISRFQRDLTDSTTLRNMGVGLGHSMLAYKSAIRGLRKVEVNKEQIALDLNEHWEVLAEPIQTVMRRYGLATPYEQLKKYTQGRKVTQQDMHDFISNECSNLPKEAFDRLLSLTPASYIGNAEQQAKNIQDYFD